MFHYEENDDDKSGKLHLLSLSLPLYEGSVNETNYHPQESGVKQNERGKKGWGD